MAQPNGRAKNTRKRDQYNTWRLFLRLMVSGQKPGNICRKRVKSLSDAMDFTVVFRIVNRDCKRCGMFGFSWKRAVGLSSLKSKISRATGVPLSKSGRRQKYGKFLGPLYFLRLIQGASKPAKQRVADVDDEGMVDDCDQESENQSGCSGCLVVLLLIGGCGYLVMGRNDKSKPAQQVVNQRPVPAADHAAPAIKINAVENQEAPRLMLKDDADHEKAVTADPGMKEEPATPDATKPTKEDESHAYGSLRLALQYVRIKNTAKAREMLEKLIQDFPDTKAAKDAAEELKKLK